MYILLYTIIYYNILGKGGTIKGGGDFARTPSYLFPRVFSRVRYRFGDIQSVAHVDRPSRPTPPLRTPCHFFVHRQRHRAISKR